MLVGTCVAAWAISPCPAEPETGEAWTAPPIDSGQIAPPECDEVEEVVPTDERLVDPLERAAAMWNEHWGCGRVRIGALNLILEPPRADLLINGDGVNGVYIGGPLGRFGFASTTLPFEDPGETDITMSAAHWDAWGHDQTSMLLHELGHLWFNDNDPEAPAVMLYEAWAEWWVPWTSVHG